MPPVHRPAPPRKSSNAAVLVVVGLTCAFLLVAGIAGIASSFLGSGEDTTDRGAGAVSSSDEAATSDATPSSSSGGESATTTTETTAEVDAEPRPVPALGDNPVNIPGGGAQSTGCDLPPFATSVDSQDVFYQAALPCLMEMWTPLLEAADLPARTPAVVTTGTDVNSPCGMRAWNRTAMYCPGNHTIYMTARYYSEVEDRTRAGVYLGQFAHEFGHALQGMTGINSAYGDALYEVGGVSTPAGLELSRRSELQATCFEGMSLAALQNGGVSNDYIFPALEDSATRGDEYNPQRDHGTVATNKVWVEQGFYKNRVTECNTWLSDASDVD